MICNHTFKMVRKESKAYRIYECKLCGYQERKKKGEQK